MPKFAILEPPFFYVTANGRRAHITIVEYPTYLDTKEGKTLCGCSGKLIHMGNRLVNNYESRSLGVDIQEICPECQADYNETWKDYKKREKPARITPAKGQRRTRKKAIEC
jgi:hypothetical protein